MTVMLGLRSIHSNQRLLVWYVIPICLFLVSLGIRVPNLSNTHSSPKPNPRAVIETSNPSSKFTAAKHVIAIEFFSGAPELLAPALFPMRFLPVIYRFTSVALPQASARAPPLFFS